MLLSPLFRLIVWQVTEPCHVQKLWEGLALGGQEAEEGTFVFITIPIVCVQIFPLLAVICYQIGFSPPLCGPSVHVKMHGLLNVIQYIDTSSEILAW